ncbi:PKD-like family lipoprotein [Pedobacter africanus]|uniref:PKD-like family protein n=1 Tax=Pedobacter africanus TaxID=151894 RepID=A0A1W1YR26_9SPHI|nr:PKD-like family lipoprotein [Pedobacter africanus]SMC38586.1 PKD-like family protein [Pedobacter africanus]
MKLINNIALWVLGASLFCTSCYKDKGNYDYKPLEEVLIDTANRNIKESYAIYRYDELNIDPKIFFNGAEITSPDQVKDKLQFTWAIYQGTSGGQVYSRDTLSNEIKLRKQISKPAGRWIVVLGVKNMGTNVETYMKFNVQVDEQLSDGWMLLYEKNGNTDVGLIVDDWTKKGVVQTRTFADMIAASNGAALSGEPRALLHSSAPIATAEVLIASARDFVAVEKSSFLVFYPIDKLFWNYMPGGEIQSVSASNGRKEVAIYNNRIHAANYNQSGTSRVNFFGSPYNGNYGELEKWSATAFGASYEAVVYDKTAKKFLNVPASGTAVQSFATQLQTAPFDVNNVGLDAEAFDWGRGNGTPAVGYEYSIMKNSTDRYLLVSNFTTAAANQIASGKYNITGIPIATPVRTLAAAFGGNYTLMGTANAVYLHRYMQGGAATVEWNAPVNEEVTCVRLQKFYYNAAVTSLLLPRPNTVVYIGTWNGSTKTGKVYAYGIDPTSGTISKSTERVYTGFGKITDMTYKWSL